MLAHLTKGETYTALAGGFGVGTTTVFHYVHDDVDVLAAVAPYPDEALDAGRRRSTVVVDTRAADRAGRRGCGDQAGRAALQC